MAYLTEKEIESLLLQGRSKNEIWEEYKDNDESVKLNFYLNNSATIEHRKKFMVLNLILAAALLFITAKKLLTAFSFGGFDIYMILSMVVPVINFYVLREILRFHKLGFKFLFILSILSLVQPENHHVLEVTILVVMAGLSGYLYKKMFPKSEQI